jgi:putrescine transport system permease protein
MVLPLYAALEKMDRTLIEAAADLGCPPWRAFFTVTVPLSRPGIVAGALLCLIPITGEFVIPELLAPSTTAMIGQTLWHEFFDNHDWPAAAALAVVLLCLLVPPILLFRRREAGQLEAAR